MNTFVWAGLAIFSVGFLLQLLSGLKYKGLMNEEAPITEDVSRKYRRIQIVGKMLFFAGISLGIFNVTIM